MSEQMALIFEEEPELKSEQIEKETDSIPAPSLFFKQDWLTFTPDTDFVEAVNRFRQRFGCEPRYSCRMAGMLWVGPAQRQ